MVIVVQRVYACALATLRVARSRAGTPAHRARGQAVTEYVLLLLGVAAIALAVTAWAAKSGKIGELLDRVFNEITSRAT